MEAITTEKLNEIKEKLINAMKVNFKRDGGLDPVALLVSQEGEMAIVPTPYTNNNEKQLMIEGIKFVCKETKPAAVVMINEAWIKQIDKKDKGAFERELKETGKSIKDYDDKKEIAIMMFETAQGHEMINYDIDRSKNELINEMRTNQVQGAFCNLLTPTKA